MNFVDLIDIPFISITLILPIIGVLLLILIPVKLESQNSPYIHKTYAKILKIVALFFSLITFIVSLPLFLDLGNHPNYPHNPQKMTQTIVQNQKIVAFVEKFPWLKPNQLNSSFDVNASFHFKIDGISILLVLMTTFFFPIILIASWNSIQIRLKEFLVSFLLMETSILGAFLAWDLLLFYLFWEFMLIPMYFIIGIWGGKQKIYAAFKFFIYTIAGSLIMLLALLFIYNQLQSFNFDDLYQNAHLLNTQFLWFDIPFDSQQILFLAFALSFAIKVPIFPFHTWLPDAHVQAPTPGSVILASVLLKMGTYGFIRLAIPLFPIASFQFAPYISILALIGIVYGAMVAFAQSDIKKLIAYSSVSHLGFITLALFSFQYQNQNPTLSFQAVHGAIYQMISHGLSTGSIFILIGMIYERCHTRNIQQFGGMAKSIPILAIFFMISTLSSIGLPGLNGFVGEFLILLGVFKNYWLHGFVASFGVLLSAIYMLFLYQKIFFGNPNKIYSVPDLSTREITSLIPLIALIIFMGVYPNYFLHKIDATLIHFFSSIPNSPIQWIP